MQTQEFRRLRRRCLPGRKQQSENEDGHHAVEHLKIERFGGEDRFDVVRGRTVKGSAALRAVAIDLRQLAAAIGTGLHTPTRLHGLEIVF